MTKPDDVLSLFQIHPDTTFIAGFGWNACIMQMPDDSAKAIAVTAQLLHPGTFEESGKWLALQLQPEDAMILAKCILEVGKERGWPEPDFEIVRTRLAGETTKH